MLISLSQAAELLGYSASGLRKLVRRREIQFFQARPHSPIKFRREWLDEFIDAGSVAPGAPAVLQVRKKKPKPYEGSGFADPSLFEI